MSSVMGGINRTNSLTYLISVREDRRNAQVGAALNNRMGQVAASTNRVKNNARGAALATETLDTLHRTPLIRSLTSSSCCRAALV